VSSPQIAATFMHGGRCAGRYLRAAGVVLRERRKAQVRSVSVRALGFFVSRATRPREARQRPAPDAVIVANQIREICGHRRPLS
jgi:hypothetical protein